MAKKELLFSVTKDDCRWDYFRSSGAGGQHRNKTDSAVRCTHRASGAVGECTEHRSQHRNKPIAFERMTKTNKFKTWHRMEVARRTGAQDEIEKRVKESMSQIRVEVKNEGLWKEVDKNDPLDV